MIFYLGTHRPTWLRRLDVPLCLSRSTLPKKKRYPALGRWGLDSGGFTALSNPPGAWAITARQWVAEVASFAEGFGMMDWAAPMDWMCEEEVLACTGLTVVEHQRRTVDNFLELRSLRPDLPFMPVLQGWTPDDYRRCVDRYLAAGIDLTAEARVGLGTICRRSDTKEAAHLISHLAASGLRLHGFGVKITALEAVGWALTSADSSSWSIDGRSPQGGRCGSPDHDQCNNCMTYALQWRERVLEALGTQQPELWAS